MFSSKNGYKAVIFDLDGTLRHTVPLGADVYREKLIEYGLDVSDETHQEVGRWEHYYWARSPELMRDAERFDGDDEAFWKNYVSMRIKKMGASDEQAEVFRPRIEKYFAEEYQPVNWVPPELHEILPMLRESGFTLAVLSNRRSPFIDLMKELALHDYFDAIMAAGEVGTWKPDPQVFDKLLGQLELMPEETVYIGDNYYADVVGARNAGIYPLLYDPRDVFEDPDCIKITSFEALIEML